MSDASTAAWRLERLRITGCLLTAGAGADVINTKGTES